MFETPAAAAGPLQRQTAGASERELAAQQIRSRPRPDSVRSRTSLTVPPDPSELIIQQQQRSGNNHSSTALIAPPSTPVRNPMAGTTAGSGNTGSSGKLTIILSV